MEFSTSDPINADGYASDVPAAAGYSVRSNRMANICIMYIESS